MMAYVFDIVHNMVKKLDPEQRNPVIFERDFRVFVVSRGGVGIVNYGTGGPQVSENGIEFHRGTIGNPGRFDTRVEEAHFKPEHKKTLDWVKSDSEKPRSFRWFADLFDMDYTAVRRAIAEKRR